MKTHNFIRLALASLLVMFVTIQCDKINDLIKFDVKLNMPTQHFTLSNPILKSTNAPIELVQNFNFYVNLDTIKQANGLSSIAIENGKFTKALLTIVSPENANLSFIINGRLILNQPNGELQIAHTGNINPEAKQIEFILDTADITSLIEQTEFSGKLYLTIDPDLMPPTAGFAFDSGIQFTVDPL